MPFKRGVKSYVLITGASRGFGQAIAVCFAQVVGQDSHFVLLGRDVKGLAETERLVLTGNDGADSKHLSVRTTSLDLLRAQEEEFDAIFVNDVASDYSQVIIVHNAGENIESMRGWLGPLVSMCLRERENILCGSDEL